MTKRVFIELPIQTLDKGSLKEITEEPELIYALEFLLEKQKFLYDAMEKFLRSMRTSDYRDVIVEVRRAIESVIEKSKYGKETRDGKKVFEICRKAYRELNIIQAKNPKLLDEKISKIFDALNDISLKLFWNIVYLCTCR